MVKTNNKTRKKKLGGFSLPWGNNLCKDMRPLGFTPWEEVPRLDQSWLARQRKPRHREFRDRTVFYPEKDIKSALKNKKFREVLKNTLKGRKDPNYVKNCNLWLHDNKTQDPNDPNRFCSTDVQTLAAYSLGEKPNIIQYDHMLFVNPDVALRNIENKNDKKQFKNIKNRKCRFTKKSAPGRPPPPTNKPTRPPPPTNKPTRPPPPTNKPTRPPPPTNKLTRPTRLPPPPPTNKLTRPARLPLPPQVTRSMTPPPEYQKTCPPGQSCPPYSSSPPPPPPPPPSTFSSSPSSGNAALLGQIQKGKTLKHVTSQKKEAAPATGKAALLGQIQKGKTLKHVNSQKKEARRASNPLESALKSNPKFASILKQRREPEEEVEGVDPSEWNGGAKRKSRKLKRKSRKPKRKSHNSTRKLRK